jgi:hypothetical protein
MRADFQSELVSLGTIFGLGLGTIASVRAGQKWQISSGFSDGERWIRTPGPGSAIASISSAFVAA